MIKILGEENGKLEMKNEEHHQKIEQLEQKEKYGH
jgi:hypothetical protein